MKAPKVISSVYWLVASNLVFMIIAIYFKWQLYDILLIFWYETFIIGSLNILKIIKTPFNPVDFRFIKRLNINVEQTSPILKLIHFFAKIFIIQFFVILFIGMVFMEGFAINAVFSYSNNQLPNQSIFSFEINDVRSFAIAVFFVSVTHAYSHVVNFIGKKEYETASLKKLIWAPFQRILLVWLVIIAGAVLINNYGNNSIILLIVYFLVKMAMDTRQHLKERSDFSNNNH